VSPVDPELVRSALERALAVARSGERATPAVPAPKELGPYLRFQKLPAAALAPVLRVLDADRGFRERVLDETAATEVDAAGWLALSQPPGWEALLGEVAAARKGDASSEEAQERLRELQKRLDATVARQDLAQAEATRAVSQAEAAREELAASRRTRRQAQEEVAAALRTIESQKERLEDLERRLADAQGAREAREHELVEAREALRVATAELDRRPPAPVAGERPVDVARLRAAASGLEAATTALAQAVSGVLGEVPAEPAAAAGASPPTRRRPLRLPGGVVEDAPDGARWLLGRPGMTVLVDGYNVAKQAWPGLGPTEERARLVRALDALAMRTGAAVEVVFDGPAEAEPGGGGSTRSVRVRFSGGATADDVVISLVDAFPPSRPVLVVSNDHEVQVGAGRRGANVVGADALIANLTG